MLHHILVCYNMLWDVCHVAVYVLSCAVLQSGMLPYALMQCRDAELSDQQPMLVFLQHKSSADIACAAQSIDLRDEHKLWSMILAYKEQVSVYWHRAHPFRFMSAAFVLAARANRCTS